ncbi:MAG TPA: hypothetical protein VD767_04965 [Thermomicrobiales bacterium]|nr:hypothetical protein [Thermomicrobiales bacterium]
MPESRRGADQAEDRGNHRYDSFVLRLWMRGDPSAFHRAEVRHVQSETVTTATNVTLEWVGKEMGRLLDRGARESKSNSADDE